MKVTTAAGYSFHQLGERDNQEDSRFPDANVSQPGQMFFVVCDGVGGSAKGELASGIVAERFGKKLKKMNFEEEFTDDKLLQVLDDAYMALDKAANEENFDMGTTMTMICFHSKGCVMAHIGDSRIYHIRPQVGIIYRSEDHSLVNQMVRFGQLSPEDAINHPHRNIITRCMGPTNPDQRRSMATVLHSNNIKAGDYMVLCSDGVNSCVTDTELIELLELPVSDQEKVALLAQRCAGSSDNNTAWVVRVDSVELTEEEEQALKEVRVLHEGDTMPINSMMISMSELESVARD